MLLLGKFNNLEVIKKVDFGFYLDGKEFDSILLPKKYAPSTLDVGQKIRVFIYKDSEDRLIATTEIPKAIVGDIALLKIKSIDENGAFLEWGLTKDLFLPFQEQLREIEKEKSYLVYLYVDKSDRICASMRLNKYLAAVSEGYRENDEVDLLVEKKTDLGWKVIVDQSCWGIVYHDDATKNLSYGQELKGFVKFVRPDKKLDIALQKAGFSKVGDVKQNILTALLEHDGRLELSDKSAPEEIKNKLGISKKSFKQALGVLYKERKVKIHPNSIELLEN